MSISTIAAASQPALAATRFPDTATASAVTPTHTAVAETSGSAPTQPAQHSDIAQALDDVRKAVAPVAQNLQFSMDQDTGRTVIKIVDSETDQVIKQIPSEEILAIAKALDKLQGLLVRQKA